MCPHSAFTEVETGPERLTRLTIVTQLASGGPGFDPGSAWTTPSPALGSLPWVPGLVGGRARRAEVGLDAPGAGRKVLSGRGWRGASGREAPGSVPLRLRSERTRLGRPRAGGRPG